jgi:hypothetical protein
MADEKESVHMQHYEKLGDRVTSLETRMAVAESHIEDIKEDIGSIKNNTIWLLRIVIGSVVAALLWLIINTPANLPGILK